MSLHTSEHPMCKTNLPAELEFPLLTDDGLLASGCAALLEGTPGNTCVEK
jgi:hypothetical protein